MVKLKRTPELQAVADAWRPPPSLTLSEWADRYRVLPTSAPEPGPWRTNRFPLIRGPMDAFTDPRIREIVLWGPTQTAKTEVILNAIGYAIHYDPAPGLVLYPVETTAQEFSTTRLEPMLNACPALKAKADIGTARTHRKSILSKTYPGMALELRGTNSPSSLASRSCRYVWLDEIDRMPTDVGGEGSPAHLARQRAQTFWNRKLVFSSTCTIDGESAIQAEYESSDRRRYHVPCLGCGRKQVLEWENLKYDGETPEEARRTARYVCPHCGREHREVDKARMLAGGEWIAENSCGDKAGFWWSALYSPWVAWGELCKEWKEAQEDDDALKVFVNCRLARTWKHKREAPAEAALSSCVDADRPLGHVPSEAVLLTGGCDVQKRVLYWVVRAWGREGRSWLVANGTIERDGPDLAELDDVFATLWDGREVRFALIDSGWDEEVVYEHCLHRKNCAPSKGTPADRDFLVHESEQTREKGRYVGRRFSLWWVNSNRIREHIHDRISIPSGEPRSWRLHADVDAEYKRHVLAWARQEKRVKGRAVAEWVQIKKDDHYLDAEIYAMAAARLPHIAPLLMAQRRSQQAAIIRSAHHEGTRGLIRRQYG